MSDELEVRAGGAVAVDTDTLRRCAAGFTAAREDLESIRGRIGALQNMLVVQRAHAGDAVSATSLLSTGLGEAIDGAARMVAELREAALVYELVELNVALRAAQLAGDSASAAQLARAREALLAQQPDALPRAEGFEWERTVMWPSELVRQATELGFTAGAEVDVRAGIYAGAAMGLATLGLAAGAGLSGQGRIRRDARLTGGGGPVALTALAPPRATASAPTSLAAVASRMPGAGASRIRVERYTMRDGSRQFAVYVAGTQSLALGGDDPWDNLSNAQLYSGSSSASYEATVAALAAAGAGPGDVIHAFGHSQGAMITAHLALEGGFDTRTHVAFGSPVEADLGAGTLSVGVRHTDDPVTALAGGGHVVPVGAPGSFVVERVADAPVGLHDATAPAHRMASYAETAALIDASADPRVGALRDVLDELSGADSVESMEFGALRAEDLTVSRPSAAGAG